MFQKFRFSWPIVDNNKVQLRVSLSEDTLNCFPKMVRPLVKNRHNDSDFGRGFSDRLGDEIADMNSWKLICSVVLKVYLGATVYILIESI